MIEELRYGSNGLLKLRLNHSEILFIIYFSERVVNILNKKFTVQVLNAKSN